LLQKQLKERDEARAQYLKNRDNLAELKLIELKDYAWLEENGPYRYTRTKLEALQ